MDQVNVATAAPERPVIATRHPLQRGGAWAVAVLAGRARPDEVTVTDLDTVAAEIVEDVVAAATAAKDTAAYDWWKVLFALYPNSKATHSKRPKEPTVLRPDIALLFRPDREPETEPVQAAATLRPCTFCGTGATVVWTKSTLPLYDTDRALNTLPPGVPGWPVCRGCRVAMWALPYGAWLTAGSATVLTCENEDAERDFVAQNVLRARRVTHLGFERMPAGTRSELVAVRALRAVRDGDFAASTLWSFKNDNQEPWLRVTRTRRAVPAFLARVDGNAVLRRGWRLLEIGLTRVDRTGQLVARGPDEAARLLFEAEDGRSRSFLGQVHELLSGSDRRWRAEDCAALTRLAFTYAEEILGMTPDLKPVATLIADWIEHGSGSPRGRFAEYRNAALSDYQLGVLLTQAQYRLMLDGRPAPSGPEDWSPLIQRRPRTWELRILLSATVVQLLQERGVTVNDTPVDPEERQRTEALLEQSNHQRAEEYEDEEEEMGPA
ncbi:hypothetical protein [Streptomyces sp. NPDC059816]|uniref:hypothetical protein n=1 Tax=Streptomyces sp. NPDC059816 TaxID=3346960 RepID=UPI00365E2448